MFFVRDIRQGYSNSTFIGANPFSLVSRLRSRRIRRSYKFDSTEYAPEWTAQLSMSLPKKGAPPRRPLCG